MTDTAVPPANAVSGLELLSPEDRIRFVATVVPSISTSTEAVELLSMSSGVKLSIYPDPEMLNVVPAAAEMMSDFGVLLAQLTPAALTFASRF